mmetsp:Transcript_2522/g.9234  ORF Transcript_2522/g.9234 Transcript_2522/m.9234 type:complete len:231 (+) Transcript_2522:741-1433(+)
MRVRSSHRVASNSSSFSIFHDARRAVRTAAASWSKPALISLRFVPSVQRRVMVVTRSLCSPAAFTASVTNWIKNCCCCCAPCAASAAASCACPFWFALISKNTLKDVFWSMLQSFQAVVPPIPMGVSATAVLFFSIGEHGPITPATFTSRDVITSNTPLCIKLGFPGASLEKRRVNESLNTACEKLSLSTTRPPVCSTVPFISANPIWSRAHANTSRQCPCVVSCVVMPL